jgi:L-ascorbate metabolism protein UlaG (beta-lactamase superfamily)
MSTLRATILPAALALALVATGPTSADGAAAGPAAGAEITYLANEGFLLSGGGRAVLVDALFGDGLADYPRVPADLRSKLEAGEPPFDEVDVVLATHHHADHFDPRAVARFLRAVPTARFLSTPQAVERLREVSGGAWDGIAPRVRSVLPAAGEAEELTVAGVAVTVFNLHHGRDRRPPVQNLGFLLALGDRRILHVGDTEAGDADLAPLRFERREIDAALLPFWLLLDAEAVETVRRRVSPRLVVPMHLGRWSAENDAWGTIHGLLPAAPRLDEAMESVELTDER